MGHSGAVIWHFDGLVVVIPLDQTAMTRFPIPVIPNHETRAYSRHLKQMPPKLTRPINRDASLGQ